MTKRKIFTKTDISIPHVEYCLDSESNLIILSAAIPPENTLVKFGRNASNTRSFDFGCWYGVRIDSITYACQRQVERFLAGQEGVITGSTVASYCQNGLRTFLDYCKLRSVALERDLTLRDVSRDLIDGYLNHLSGLGNPPTKTTQKSRYSKAKSVLLALGRRGLIPLVTSGDMATFPRNPFPNNNRNAKGETALSKHERTIFTIALHQAIRPIWTNQEPLKGEILALALLVVALHTGRNCTPLLEMSRDCLRPHPKPDTVFLVLWKRRGYNSNKVALRARPNGIHGIESMPSIKLNVEQLIRRVIAQTEHLNLIAPDDLKGRVWLYRKSNRRGSKGPITALNCGALNNATNRLVTEYGLVDCDGHPLRLNISRLRKTFANRVFELTHGDLAATANAIGSTLQITDQNYLAPSHSTRRDWRFMGEVLVEELMSNRIGASYKQTPLGRCAESFQQQYAVNREGATCMNFTNCLRCQHYAVTAEDLYKLFSFYFRVLAERSRMDKKRWAKNYAHIPRLIDTYIIKEGLRRGVFKSKDVEAARERARNIPHPFWSFDLIENLQVLT